MAAEVLRELSPITQRAVGCEQWLGGTNVFFVHPFPAEFSARLDSRHEREEASNGSK